MLAEILLVSFTAVVLVLGVLLALYVSILIIIIIRKEMKPKPLVPCKYCGGEPTLKRNGDYKQYYVYRCSDCGEPPAFWFEGKITERAARKLWNRRSL